MNNEFTQIPEFLLYEINRKGEVRNIQTKHILSPCNHKGYHRVLLCGNGKRKDNYIHRLVALTFLSNPDNKPQINHINGIKSDNRLENLEWCTGRDNIAHALKTGLLVNPKGEENPLSRLTEKEVKEIRHLIDMGTSQKEVSLLFNVKQCTISQIYNKKRWAHI